jgi:hypothetical protein
MLEDIGSLTASSSPCSVATSRSPRRYVRSDSARSPRQLMRKGRYDDLGHPQNRCCGLIWPAAKSNVVKACDA